MPPLTPRQSQVVALVGQGLSDKQIASQLSIATKTASKLKETAKDRLSTTTVGLIHYALHHGLTKNLYQHQARDLQV